MVSLLLFFKRSVASRAYQSFDRSGSLLNLGVALVFTRLNRFPYAMTQVILQ